MFKILLLCGFVASALAGPVSEVPSDTAIDAVVKECHKRCESTYKTSDSDYSLCLFGCTVGVKKSEEKVGAVIPSLIAVSAGQARGFDYCANKCVVLVLFPPAFGSCIAVCLAAGGRRRSIEYPRDELIPVTDVDYIQKSARYVKDCNERCRALYPSSESDFLDCFNECSIGGQKRDINVDVTLEPVDGVRQARGYSDCVSECVASYGSLVSAGTAGCFIRCAFDRKLEDSPTKRDVVAGVKETRDVAEDCRRRCRLNANLPPVYVRCLQICKSHSKKMNVDQAFSTGNELPADFASPNFPSSSSAQPIESGMLMQITEPITNILSQVIKKQQEMMQMINSCICAKPAFPTNPSLPYGQGNSDVMGPSF